MYARTVHPWRMHRNRYFMCERNPPEVLTPSWICSFSVERENNSHKHRRKRGDVCMYLFRVGLPSKSIDPDLPGGLFTFKKFWEIWISLSAKIYNCTNVFHFLSIWHVRVSFFHFVSIEVIHPFLLILLASSCHHVSSESFEAIHFRSLFFNDLSGFWVQLVTYSRL